MNYDLEEMEAFFKGFSKLDKEGQEQIIEIKEDFDNREVKTNFASQRKTATHNAVEKLFRVMNND